MDTLNLGRAAEARSDRAVSPRNTEPASGGGIKAPPVGIVVANHDNAAYVARALASIARQTVQDLRVVVVDDASTDHSDAVIRETLSRLGDRRFDYVRLTRNLGQAGAVRSGLARLDTPFVCFLDSDDVWYDGFLAAHLAVHLNSDFPVALTYCDSHVIDAADRLIAGTAWWFDFEPEIRLARPVEPARLPRLDPASGQLAYPVNAKVTFRPRWSVDAATNSTASMMLRRSFVDLALVVPDAALRLYLDYYLASFALLMTGAMAIDQTLYAYRMHGQNKHSDGAVPGGAYNSGSRPWQPIARGILRQILAVLDDDPERFARVFGRPRVDLARRSLRAALRPPLLAQPLAALRTMLTMASRART